MFNVLRDLRKFAVLLAVVVALPLTIKAQAIEVSLPDLTGDTGESVNIPVTTGELDGQNVWSYELTIVYDEDVVDITGFDASGTISDGMSIVPNATKQDTFILGAAGSTALTGSGTLVNLTAEFVGQGTTDLTFQEFVYNEGTPSVTLTNGSVVIGGTEIEVGVQNTMILQDSSSAVAVTVGDLSGQSVSAYEFTLTYDTSVVEITGTDAAGTISDGISLSSNSQTAGEFTVAGASSQSLSGSGTLLNLMVNGVASGTTAVDFSDFQFNEGVPMASVTGGTLSVNAPPSAFMTTAPADEDTVTAGSDATLEWEPSVDPEGQGLTYTVTVMGNDTSFTTTDTSATLSADYLLSYLGGGESATLEWYVEASDGHFTVMSDTSSIILWNPAPGPYTLIAPVDEQIVVDSLEEEYTASWHPAEGPEGVSFTYTMKFVGLEISLEAGSDTSLTLTGQQLLDQFVAPEAYSAELSWYVEASNGSAVTVSDTGTFHIYDVTRTMPLAEVRLDENNDDEPDKMGHIARVEGLISSPSFDPGGTLYYMQDAENTAGVAFTSDYHYDFNEGDELQIIAEIGYYEGRTEIAPVDSEDVTILSTDNAVNPVEVSILDIGESYESRLVTVGWLDIVTDEWPAEDEEATVIATDTTGFDVELGIHPSTNLDGSEAPELGLYNVTGIVAQNDPYKIRPRSTDDLEFIEGTDIESGKNLPDEFALGQNYPNPFNPTTTIKFQLPKSASVNLTVYNMVGRQVATLVNTEMDAGYHQVTWNGTDNTGQRVATGVYFYRINAGEFTTTKKMIMMK